LERSNEGTKESLGDAALKTPSWSHETQNRRKQRRHNSVHPDDHNVKITANSVRFGAAWDTSKKARQKKRCGGQKTKRRAARGGGEGRGFPKLHPELEDIENPTKDGTEDYRENNNQKVVQKKKMGWGGGGPYSRV